jgi:hypothetical protein
MLVNSIANSYLNVTRETFMKLLTRQKRMLTGKSIEVVVILRAFVKVRKFMRLTLTFVLSLAALSGHQTASTVPMTHVFTAVTDLSFFGGDGTDEFQISYTCDTDLVAQGTTAGRSRYGPITGNVRADSVTGSFNLDFDTSNINTSNLLVRDNATVFLSPSSAEFFSMDFPTTSKFLFAGELLSGFSLSLIDEQATISASPALPSDTDFFAGIDAINLRFNDPHQFDEHREHSLTHGAATAIVCCQPCRDGRCRLAQKPRNHRLRVGNTGDSR